MHQSIRALGRLKAGEMNDTEAAYARMLDERRIAGEVAWWKFEGLTFRLANRTGYTPDFIVMLSGGELEAHEVKGHWMEDARVKIKVAAATFPVKFLAIVGKKNAKRDGGGYTWATEEF